MQFTRNWKASFKSFQSVAKGSGVGTGFAAADFALTGFSYQNTLQSKQISEGKGENDSNSGVVYAVPDEKIQRADKLGIGTSADEDDYVIVKPRPDVDPEVNNNPDYGPLSGAEVKAAIEILKEDDVLNEVLPDVRNSLQQLDERVVISIWDKVSKNLLENPKIIMAYQDKLKLNKGDSCGACEDSMVELSCCSSPSSTLSNLSSLHSQPLSTTRLSWLELCAEIKCPCAICQDLVAAPVILVSAFGECGHTFCGSCLQDQMDTCKSEDIEVVHNCSLCKQPIDKSTYERQLDDLILQRVSRAEDCKQKDDWVQRRELYFKRKEQYKYVEKVAKEEAESFYTQYGIGTEEGEYVPYAITIVSLIIAAAGIIWEYRRRMATKK